MEGNIRLSIIKRKSFHNFGYDQNLRTIKQTA